MGRRDAQLLTDFCRFDAEMLAHQEHLPGARGQSSEAFFQRFQELLVLERLPWTQRVALRLHLAICDACTSFSRQVGLLRAAVRRLV